MFRRLLLSLAVLVGSMPLWCQVEPSASGGSGSTDDDSLMTMPAAISGSFYPSEVGSQARENLLSGGLLFTVAYDDNILSGEGTGTIGAESYTIVPNIALSTSTARLRGSLNYSPGFIFFHPTTYLNQVTQNADADFQYRWTPHTTVAVQEVFRQNSTVFSEPYTFSGATISGSGSSGYPIVIAPYAGQISDSTSAHVGYQFSRSSMISASGNYSLFSFSDSTESQGLYNSHGGGGSGSYSRRFGRAQYLGLTYRYAISETPYPSTTKSQFASVFYSVRLSNSFSLSASGGPEYTTTTTTTAQVSTAIATWAPSGNASIGWQGRRTAVALGYSRAVTTGWGLVGSFTADSATASVRWQFTQRLTGGLTGNYSNTKNATPSITTTSLTGHTLFGRASLEYRLGERLTAVGEYSRLHDSYFGVPAISNYPDVDRVAISLNYGFRRPLGR
jgi:hypothetical protein